MPPLGHNYNSGPSVGPGTGRVSMQTGAVRGGTAVTGYAPSKDQSRIQSSGGSTHNMNMSGPPGVMPGSAVPMGGAHNYNGGGGGSIQTGHGGSGIGNVVGALASRVGYEGPGNRSFGGGSINGGIAGGIGSHGTYFGNTHTARPPSITPQLTLRSLRPGAGTTGRA